VLLLFNLRIVKVVLASCPVFRLDYTVDYKMRLEECTVGLNLLLSILLVVLHSADSGHQRGVKQYTLQYSLCLEPLGRGPASGSSTCTTLATSQLFVLADTTAGTRTVVIRAKELLVNGSSVGSETFGARAEDGGALVDYHVSAHVPPVLKDVFRRLCQVLLDPSAAEDASSSFLQCRETSSERTDASWRTVKECESPPDPRAGVLYDTFSLTADHKAEWRAEGSGPVLSRWRLAESLRHAVNLRPDFGERVETLLELLEVEKEEEQVVEEEFSLQHVDLFRNVFLSLIMML
jgi:hypothetical protein